MPLQAGFVSIEGTPYNKVGTRLCSEGLNSHSPAGRVTALGTNVFIPLGRTLGSVLIKEKLLEIGNTS